MNTPRNLFAVLGLALLACGSVVQAGGYMRSGGETYLSVGLKMDLGDRFFDKSGKRRSGDCDSGFSVPVYVDHGLSYYTNVFASSALRYKECPGESSSSIGDTLVGLRRRVDPLANDWVWEAALILPTSRIGATQASDAAEWGVDLGLHSRPRPDPYRLDLNKDPLASQWDFGTGLRAWAGHLPLEWWANVAYSRALSETNWMLGQRGWYFSGSLDWHQSIARTHDTEAAVDVHDRYHLLGLTLGLSYPLAKFESFRISLHRSLLGENRDDASGISLGYGKTFR